MTIAVVTSCSARGWEEYGKLFAETYAQYWPKGIPLYLVSEDAPLLPKSEAQQLHLLLSEVASDFLRRHEDNLLAHGRIRVPQASGWSPKKIAEHYNFRYDAFRFAKKVFAIEFVARTFVKSGRLFWIDADVVTFAPVDMDMLVRLLPDDKALSCLDRGTYHSECGFVGYNIEHPACLPFIQEFARLYSSDEVFDLEQWHDSWVFDWLRRKMEVPAHAIPHQSRHHPFANAPDLSCCLDHKKGRRKGIGRTPSGERIIKDDIPYWASP